MTDYASDPNVKKLESFFRHHPVARLDELRGALHASGRTVFRILSRMGYLSSCSHAGKYYTLAQTPAFDADGLWAHSGVLFSSHRTLRRTVVHLVNQAPAGHTHPELQDRLRLRVYDTLHDLVAAGEIGRTVIDRLYLYASAEPEAAAAQVTERRRLIAGPPPSIPLPDPAVVIEVLLAVIHSPKPEVALLAAMMRAQGKAVTREQVQAVWAHYDLCKRSPVR